MTDKINLVSTEKGEESTNRSSDRIEKMVDRLIEEMETEKMEQKRKRGINEEEEEDYEVKPPENKSPSRKQIIFLEEEVEGDEEVGAKEPNISCLEDEYDKEGPSTFWYNEGVFGNSDADKKNSCEKKKRGRGRPKKIRRSALGMAELGVHEISDSDDEEGYDKTQVAEAGARALEYLEKIDEIRKKSGNIREDLSGVIKRRVKDITEIIKVLMSKAQRKENCIMETEEDRKNEEKIRKLEANNKELQNMVEQGKKDAEMREREIGILHRMRKEAKKEMESLKERLKKMEQGFIDEERKKLKKKKEVRSTYPVSDEDRSYESKVEDSHGRTEIRKKERRCKEYYDERNYERKKLNNKKENRSIYSESDDRESEGEETHGKYKRRQEGRRYKEYYEEQEYLPDNTTDYRTSRGSPFQQLHRQSEIERRKYEGRGGMIGGKEITEKEYPPLTSKRKDIKLVRNVQLVPPREGSTKKLKGREEVSDSEDWKVVRTKKAMKETRKQERNRTEEKVLRLRRRTPRTAAVTITGLQENFSYAEALRRTRNDAIVKQLGTENTRIRKTAVGGILIEVIGEREEREEKADKLAKAFQRILESNARVSRPRIKGEIRLLGIDDSITREEIIEVLKQTENCNMEEIKLGEIKPMRNGLGIVWAQCPLSTAIELAKKEYIRIGWSRIKVELLKARPRQCYRCWKLGHLKQNCTSKLDRTRTCYKCGEEGHQAKICGKEICCIVCKEEGMDAGHRYGSMECKNNRRIKDGYNPERREKASQSAVRNVRRDRNMEMTRRNQERLEMEKDAVERE